MHIDPHAWLITAPLSAGLVQLYFQPADFVIKRWWTRLVEWESQTWGRLSLIGWATRCSDASTLYTRAIYSMSLAAFSACTVASFAAFIGAV